MIIPKKIKNLFEVQALVAVGTADSKGNPNVVPIYWKKMLNNCRIIFIDNFMNETKKNIIENNMMCVSFWDSETEEGYKLKGNCSYHESGEIFEKGKIFFQSKNPDRVPRGVVEFNVEEIYSITPGIKAGERIA
ncbi:MAG: pyridoxamine 5'-phosphate oxidase family protein [Nanoarchaeota archaeon]|nr:pyridoxamine 5'-phosphate oxidase family protein [Nanoarchaeota archaeon]